MTRAIIYIDGNNFYHNTQKEGLNPNKIDFRKLSKHVAQSFDCSWEETYYYNSIPSIDTNKEKYHSHLGFLNSLRYLPKFTVRTKKLQKPSEEEIQRKKKDLLERTDICYDCRTAIKEKYQKHLEDLSKKEKGIDVVITTDMIKEALKNRYDTAILITGDSQFIPALELIEEENKKPATSFVFQGYANELRDKFDYHVLKKEELKDCYYEE